MREGREVSFLLNEKTQAPTHESDQLLSDVGHEGVKRSHQPGVVGEDVLPVSIDRAEELRDGSRGQLPAPSLQQKVDDAP